MLKQAEVGVPLVELILKVGITEQTYCRWRAKYAGLEVNQVRQVKQLLGSASMRLAAYWLANSLRVL